MNFYKPQKIAGKALRLSGTNKVSFSQSLDEIENNLGIDFWLKCDLRNRRFLKILKPGSDEEILNLAVSAYGYFTSNQLLNANVYEEFYIGPNSWNHIFLLLDKEKNIIDLYVNDTLSIQFNFTKPLPEDDIEIIFETKTQNEKVSIDNLRFLELSGNLEPLFAQKNFLNISNKSFKRLSTYQFDGNSAQGNNPDVSAEKGKLVASNAPLYSKAPNITVSMFENINQIDVRINDLTDVSEIVVEKSYNGSDFRPVQTITNIIPDKNIYSVDDFDDSEHQIVYYRVKQISDSDEVIYSNSVKLGRGERLHFEVNQNYPNPFNPNTLISINVKREAEFEVLVYDVVGKLVAKLHDGPLAKGIHQFEFTAVDLPSGIYFTEVKSETELIVTKMILAK